MKWNPEHLANASVQLLRRRRRLIELAAIVGSPLYPIARAFAQQPAADKPLQTVRIGYQKFNTFNILKGTGAFERAVGPNVAVRWYEFAAGPQLLEALSTGAIDFGHADLFQGINAQSLVWQPILTWLQAH